MEYRKPELTELGNAVEAIQSVLMKGPAEWDQAGEPLRTNPAAYHADE
jgi:hypothetical protein